MLFLWKVMKEVQIIFREFQINFSRISSIKKLLCDKKFLKASVYTTINVGK